MSSKLFISLSMVALLGLSTVAYGDWIWYSKDNSVSKPEGRLPNGDCLELICKHGCVEDANNEYLGGCCPSNGTSGKACTVDGKYVNTCCQEGLSCEKGKCKATTCQVDGKTYKEGDTISECSKCQDGKEKIDLTVVSSKSMGDTCTEECGCGNSTLKCSDDEYCCPVTTPTEGQSCHANCPCDGELHCVDGTCQKSCVKNVDWGKPCTDDCQCKDGTTGDFKGYSGVCVDGVCCYEGCVFCGSDTYCPGDESEEESEDESENESEGEEDEFVCEGKTSVKKDGNVSRVCCKTNNHKSDYNYSVTGSGRLGGWQIYIYDKSGKKIRNSCIGGWKKGKCGNRSKNQNMKPSNFNAIVHPGEEACMYFYSNGGGSGNYKVWLKKVK